LNDGKLAVEKQELRIMALFTKGQSGNPSGRKPGSRNQINIMKEALKSYNQLNGVNATEAIIHKVIDLALVEGDMGAAKLILELVASGEITSDIAKELLASITMLLKVKEVTELDSRLAELEKSQGVEVPLTHGD